MFSCMKGGDSVLPKGCAFFPILSPLAYGITLAMRLYYTVALAGCFGLQYHKFVAENTFTSLYLCTSWGLYGDQGK